MPHTAQTRLVGIAILLILVATVAYGGWLWSRSFFLDPLDSLASAYGQQRTMEMRVPGAAFAVAVVRRGRRGNAGQPASFYEAFARIKRGLAADSSDATLMHARGRAQLIAGEIDTVRTLQNAADLGADTPNFWIDYGSAYFELAERVAPGRNIAPSADEYVRAVEMVSRALALEPRNPVALFNRGVILSKLGLFNWAAKDFETCVRGERDGNWRREAEARLEQSRGKAKALFNQKYELSIEDDLRTALSGGIVEALKGKGDPRLTQLLADRLAGSAGDLWLRDVLRTPALRKDLSSIEVLSRVARLRLGVNDARDIKPGLARPLTANEVQAEIDQLAKRPLPAPLSSWRSLEILFRQSHSRQRLCSPADGALASAAHKHYRMIEIQIRLELSSCVSQQDRLDDAMQQITRAAQLARAAGYRAAELRALGFLTSNYVNQGRYREAYQSAFDAIAHSQDGSIPLRRVYEFYNQLMRASDELGHWNVARAARPGPLQTSLQRSVKGNTNLYRKHASQASQLDSLSRKMLLMKLNRPARS